MVVLDMYMYSWELDNNLIGLVGQQLEKQGWGSLGKTLVNGPMEVKNKIWTNFVLHINSVKTLFTMGRH